MKRAMLILLCALLVIPAGCTRVDEGKMPITTASDQALKFYLQGRDLAEKLRATDAREYFEKAVQSDPDFALAHLNLSLTVGTARGFFEELDKAVALSDKVSEAERCWILGSQAGANGNPSKQKENYEKMVTLCPNDERAHTILGNYYFGVQDYATAIQHFEKSNQINPKFSQPYNQMGYAYRFLGNFADAEKTFLKYIELIPDDPNPQDSYAELLLKMGRFEESITAYRKALEINKNFIASHIGIATDLNYLGRHAEARQELEKLSGVARNDGEQRAAIFSTAISYMDEGNAEKALEELRKQYAIAEKINDYTNMSGDVGAMGNILFETGQYDQAMAMFDKSLQLVLDSNRSQEIKDNARLIFLFNKGRVSLMKNDLTGAKEYSRQYSEQAMAKNSPFQIWLAHQLRGMIAMAEKNYDAAIQEFQQDNQQNPYTFYRLAMAYEGKGDKESAKQYFNQAANFNALNNMNQAFVRNKAKGKLSLM